MFGDGKHMNDPQTTRNSIRSANVRTNPGPSGFAESNRELREFCTESTQATTRKNLENPPTRPDWPNFRQRREKLPETMRQLPEMTRKTIENPMQNFRKIYTIHTHIDTYNTRRSSPGDHYVQVGNQKRSHPDAMMRVSKRL